MSNALIGHWPQIGSVVAKAALLFVLVVVFLRLSPRRTLSQMFVFDFVTAIAVGSIVGRVPNASDTSFAAGGVTLIVVLALHRLVTIARVTTTFGKLLDRHPVILVRDGHTDQRQLRREHLTADDLASLLRSKGVTKLDERQCVIFEPNGSISLVLATDLPDNRFPGTGIPTASSSEV